MTTHNDMSFGQYTTLDVDHQSYDIFPLEQARNAGVDLDTLPKSLKVLLENLLRHFDGKSISDDHIKAFAKWQQEKSSKQEIYYRPARVLMQDFTGVPAVVDLAAMRDAVSKMGADPKKINPLAPVDLVIDHSVMVDQFGSDHAFVHNVKREFERNKERYEFLKWGQTALNHFRVVPPGTGICHQVNLEYLAKTVWTQEKDGHKNPVAYPDTLVGTDSHTTMVNGLAVLGWGVGGIEAEAAMLGQPVTMLIPEVVGFELTGKMTEGATATDLVLTIVEMLRKRGVVGKFVEFYGDGLDQLSLADRATISNMAPEYGATCGFFPIDDEVLNYMRLTSRDEDQIALVREYAKAQGLWRNKGEKIDFTDTLSLDMNTVEPSLAGPKRPQDRILLSKASSAFDEQVLAENKISAARSVKIDADKSESGEAYTLSDGDVVIGAITSCTNTSNPSVMIGAGLVARKARALGLTVKPWVKTSLAPGSQVVTDYLEKSGLQEDLDALGFQLVGYGCTTCIGNSGPLPDEVAGAINDGDLAVASVLSGNRNFEGRVHAQVKANYLASPPLVVAYSLLGTMRKDITTEPIGQDKNGNDVYLRDIWPSNAEIAEIVNSMVTPDTFKTRYADVFKGEDEWQKINVSGGLTYDWNEASTYVKNPPFFDELVTAHLSGDNNNDTKAESIEKANILALLGDSVTTDHISPAGAIKADSPAGFYLRNQNIDQRDFNSFGSRRGNHEVMMRGTFANIRIRNKMVPGVEGGFTKYIPTGDQLSIYDAAMRYQAEKTPLVVIGGKEYGTGSSRDWAAKGTRLLGVKAVITQSFERIHRSNLIGMGVLPLQFKGDESADTLGLTGDEVISIRGIGKDLVPGGDVTMIIDYPNGMQRATTLLCRVDTEDEMNYYQNDGILHYVLKNIVA